MSNKNKIPPASRHTATTICSIKIDNSKWVNFSEFTKRMKELSIITVDINRRIKRAKQEKAAGAAKANDLRAWLIALSETFFLHDEAKFNTLVAPLVPKIFSTRPPFELDTLRQISERLTNALYQPNQIPPEK